MEQNLKHIDNLFREGLGSYTETPPPSVWDSLEERLDNNDKKRPGIYYRWPWFIILLAFIGVGGGSLLAWRMSGDGAATAYAPKANTEATAPQPKTALDTDKDAVAATTVNTTAENTAAQPANAGKGHTRHSNQNEGQPAIAANSTAQAIESAVPAQPLAGKNERPVTGPATGKNIAMDNAMAMAPVNNDLGNAEAQPSVKATVIKYIVKNSTHNNIQVAESEPVVVNVREEHRDNTISNPVGDDEDDVVFGAKAAAKATVHNSNYASATRVSTKPAAALGKATATTNSIHNNTTAKAAPTASNTRIRLTPAGNTSGKQANGGVATNNVSAKVMPTAKNEVAGSNNSNVVATGSTKVKAETAIVPDNMPTASKSVTASTVKSKSAPATVAANDAATAHKAVANKEAATAPSIQKGNEKTSVAAIAGTNGKATNLNTVTKGQKIPATAQVKEGSAAPTSNSTKNVSAPVIAPITSYAAGNNLPAITKAVASATNAKATAGNTAATSHAKGTKVPAQAVVTGNTPVAMAKTGSTTVAAPKQGLAIKPTGQATTIATTHGEGLVAKAKAKKAGVTKQVAVASPANTIAEEQPIAAAGKPTLAKVAKVAATKASLSAKPVAHAKQTADNANAANEEAEGQPVAANQKHATKQKPAKKTGVAENSIAAATKAEKTEVAKLALNSKKTSKQPETKTQTAKETATATAQPAKAVPAAAEVKPVVAQAKVTEAAKAATAVKHDSVAVAKVAKADSTPATAATENPAGKPARTFLGFEVGVKAGFEGGFNNGTAQKFVITPFLERKLSNKFSLLIQPGIKYAGVKSKTLDGSQSYYEVNNNSTQVRMDSIPIYNQNGIVDFWVHHDTVTQSHQSVVKTYAAGGRYLEFELPLLIKYNITKKLSAYGGVNISYSKLVGIHESTLTSGQISATMDTTYMVRAGVVQAHPSIASIMQYSGTPLSGYKGPLYPSPTGGSFRLGYMLGFSYQFNKRWLADVLLQQGNAKVNMQGGYNVNTAISSTYFRFTVGYKLFQ